MPRTKTLSADFYHSSSVFDQEIKNIFKKEWLWVARSDELSEPGSFLTTEIIEYPIIVLRDHSGNLRAYHNVCRHRAAKVVSSKSGVCKHMICPYHGWKYNLNGQLMDTPKFFANDDFDESRHSLFDILIEERFGLIFINLKTNCCINFLSQAPISISKNLESKFVLCKLLSSFFTQPNIS